MIIVGKAPFIKEIDDAIATFLAEQSQPVDFILLDEEEWHSAIKEGLVSDKDSEFIYKDIYIVKYGCMPSNKNRVSVTFDAYAKNHNHGYKEVVKNGR
jgi:hypothetical protein